MSKAVKGNKDDTKNSKWIGDLFRLGLFPESFIPSKEIRILRNTHVTVLNSHPVNGVKKTFPECTYRL